ncbi:DNA-directed RNA polymerase subunit beta-like [Ziziphus jujuba]|uniref:DNA-directed RNA polymerase n=1 Tax=Ziziphus jujuba TaxID=326968 RepID=A0ABM3ZWT6_ZIZJJ|nr:DNA-directed RNA polymerase subunit beta-like [Ziziphus jujuba]
MSSNMQRQAVPISQSEKCIVGTGLECQVALDFGVLAVAEHEGKIIYIDTDKIFLLGNGDTLSIPLVIYQRSNKILVCIKKLKLRERKGQAGGQWVGEIEVWALEGFGVAYILQKMLTYKSDHISARQEVPGTTIIGRTIPKPEDAPESFQFLVRELRSLALKLKHFLVSEKNLQINRKDA